MCIHLYTFVTILGLKSTSYYVPNLNILPGRNIIQFHIYHPFLYSNFINLSAWNSHLNFFCNKTYLIRNLINSHYYSDLFITIFCCFFLAAGVFASLNYADWIKKKWIKMVFPIVSKTYIFSDTVQRYTCILQVFISDFPSLIINTCNGILTNPQEIHWWSSNESQATLSY